jgi:hypothetical protein
MNMLSTNYRNGTLAASLVLNNLLISELLLFGSQVPLRCIGIAVVEFAVLNGT